MIYWIHFYIKRGIMNTTIKFVTKANGELEPWDETKILKWISWSTLSPDRVYEIMLHLSSILYDGIKTSEIQQAIINYCTSQDDYEFHTPAARLFLGALYHKVFHKVKGLPTFKEFYKSRIKLGFWVDMGYTDKQLEKLSDSLDPERDFSYSYSEMKSIYNTYLLKDLNKNPVETFQYFYMGISAYLMKDELDPVSDTISLYNALSQHKVSLPTPILSAARTGDNSFASCCLVESGDTADSIGAAVDVSYTMTTNRAGIGAFLNTRSISDPVRNGKTYHTGKLPYFRYLAGAIKSTTQFARRGSGTTHFIPHDPELFSLLALKNIKTPLDYRIQEIDYSMEINTLLVNKILKNEKWLLISKYYAPDLYQEFFNPDNRRYIELYKKYSNMVENGEIKGKLVNARDVGSEKMKQWVETGRFYSSFTDNMNSDTPFYDQIHMSNLCLSGETIVETSNGNKKIKDIEVGDKVKSKNLETGNIEYKNVSYSGMTNKSSEVFEISDPETGKSITCTGDHKIYTKNRGYVMAKDLEETDELDIL